MYRPPHFDEPALDEQHRIMRQAGLACLVTPDQDGGMCANHLPFLLVADQGPYGTLYGHLSRANAQGRDAATALVIFQGADGYVSPNWYPSKQQTGRGVPTWNFVAVHAHGPVQVFDDTDRLLWLVDQLTQRHEGGRPHPWTVGQAPDDFIQAQLRGIIGIRIPIQRIEGKRKLSQNRSPADQQGVIHGLRAEGTDAAQAVADEMDILMRRD